MCNGVVQELAVMALLLVSPVATRLQWCWWKTCCCTKFSVRTAAGEGKARC